MCKKRVFKVAVRDPAHMRGLWPQVRQHTAPSQLKNASGRNCTYPFWQNDHCDFIHRWIELNFGYGVPNSLIFN